MPQFAASTSSCFYLTYIFLFMPSFLFSQDTNRLHSYKGLSRAEKNWVWLHPFAAGRAWEATQKTKMLSKTVKDSLPDNDLAGGQADAFRHAMWMAILTREINWRKAKKLGIAHEKGNEEEFKKGIAEDGYIPDRASTEMDLFNNESGILIGRQYSDVSEDSLIKIIKASVLSGQMKIIKKDSLGNSLDEAGRVIPESEWKGQWENRRVLVRSDYRSTIKD